MLFAYDNFDQYDKVKIVKQYSNKLWEKNFIIRSYVCGTLKGDKVSILTYAYLYKLQRNIKRVIYNHQADSPFHLWL